MRTHNCGCFATLLAAAAAERVETYSLLLLLACVYRFICALLTKGQNGESQRHILLDVVDDVLQSQMSRNLHTHTRISKQRISLLLPGLHQGQPASAILNCLLAHQLCAEDPSCKSIETVIQHICGPETGTHV
jgi:hypothetical protein